MKAKAIRALAALMALALLTLAACSDKPEPDSVAEPTEPSSPSSEITEPEPPEPPSGEESRIRSDPNIRAEEDAEASGEDSRIRSDPNVRAEEDAEAGGEDSGRIVSDANARAEESAPSSDTPGSPPTPVCLLDYADYPATERPDVGIYAGGYFYTDWLYRTVRKFDGGSVWDTGRRGTLLRANERGYVVVNDGMAELFDKDSDALLERRTFPSDILVYQESLSTMNTLKDVAGDLRAILYASQGGDIYAGEEYVENGVLLLRDGRETPENIMPGGYYYETARFVNDNTMAVAIRVDSAANREETVIYDFASGVIKTIFIEALDERGLSSFFGISDYYILYAGQFYDIRNDAFVPVDYGKAYTITSEGDLYYVNDDSMLMKRDTRTGWEEATGLTLPKGGVWWLTSQSPDVLVASVKYEDKAAASGIYLFRLA